MHRGVYLNFNGNLATKKNVFCVKRKGQQNNCTHSYTDSYERVYGVFVFFFLKTHHNHTLKQHIVDNIS